jgi:hypothetical protein
MRNRPKEVFQVYVSFQATSVSAAALYAKNLQLCRELGSVAVVWTESTLPNILRDPR